MITSKISKLLALTAITAILGTGLAGTAAVAQDKGAVERSGHLRKYAGSKGRLGDRLGLSEAQKKQIVEIRSQAREQAKAVWANDGQTVGALKSQLKNLRETTKTRIEAVLTPDQRAMLDKAHNKFKGNSKGKGVPPPRA